MIDICPFCGAAELAASTVAGGPRSPRRRRKARVRDDADRRASVAKFDRQRDSVHQRAVAQHGDLHPLPDRVRKEALLQRLSIAERGAIDREDHVAGPQAALRCRAVLHHLDDAQCAALPEALGLDGRQLGRGAHQAEVGAPHPPVMHQRVDDPVGRGIDGYGEAEADPGDRGVDPDDTAVAVGQRTPGVAWVECRVGLDDVLDQARGSPASRRHAAAERAHDARGHGAREPERVADRDHERADEQRSLRRRTQGVPAPPGRRGRRPGRTAGHGPRHRNGQPCRQRTPRCRRPRRRRRGRW